MRRGKTALTLHSDVHLEGVDNVCIVLAVLAYETFLLAQRAFVDVLRKLRDHLKEQWLFIIDKSTHRRKEQNR